MQTQLTLPIGLSDYASFDNYFIGSNLEVVTAIQDFIEETSGGLIFLFGGHGSGKTHLLYAAQKYALGKSQRADYFSMSDAQVTEHVTSFIDLGELVCIDDVHVVAGSDRLERVLFNLIEQQRQLRHGMIMAAGQPKQGIPFVMRDLLSRIRGSVSYRIRVLNDQQKKDAVRLRARHRGIELADDVIDYVLKRSPRDTVSLFALLDRIDKESLSKQRTVTIPFIKQLEAVEN